MGNEMGNNNTSVLREEESSKLEDNGKSALVSVGVEESRDHVFLADEGNDRDEKVTGSVPDDPDSLTNCHDGKEKTCNGIPSLNESAETELQTEESEERKYEKHSSAEPNSSENGGDMHLDGSESLSVTVDGQLGTQTSVAEGEHEFSEPETEKVGNGLILTQSDEERACVDDVNVSRSVRESASSEETDEKPVKEERESQEENVSEEDKFDVRDELSAETENGTEEKLCENDVFVSRSCQESVASEETNVETIKDTLLREDNVSEDEKFDVKEEISAETQKHSTEGDLLEIHKEQRVGEGGFSEERPEIQNLENNNQDAKSLENGHLVDVLFVADEEKAETVDELIKEEIKPINQKSGGEGRETNMKRMFRSRSLPVSRTNRLLTDSLVQPANEETGKSRIVVESNAHCPSESLLSQVAWPPINKMDSKEGRPKKVLEPQTTENLSVSCVGRKKAQETTETNSERITEADPEMRSPSFGSDLRIEARMEELSDKTPLLYQDKAETHEAKMAVEEKAVMLEKTDSGKSRTEFLGFLKTEEEIEGKSSAEDEGNAGSGDNLRDKKAPLGSPKGKERSRRRGTLFSTCLCCATVIN